MSININHFFSIFYYYHKIKFIILYLLTIKLGNNECNINDNFETNILEENSQLLDVTDYHNFSLIVTMTKNIYIGIPPKKKTLTTANLINATSIITINENYILAACLKDSLLTKININTGFSTSLLNYSNIENISLDIPITSCSLSNINNIIFIGYTRIDYFEKEVNKTNIIIRFNITNINSENGPELEEPFDIKIFVFPNSTIKTNSSRQISCETLKIEKTEKIRLVCMHELLKYAEDYKRFRFYVYATTINENLDGFENKFDENSIYRVDENSGFRIYRLNNNKARCVMKKQIKDISLKNESGKIKIKENDVKSNIKEPTANLDLFDYNNGLVFFAEKINFSNINEIYYLRINNETSKIYFKLFNYKENNIIKILGYYNKTNENIIFLYQTLTHIKYFSFINNPYIQSINKMSISKIFEPKSNQEILYNISDLLDVSTFGNLNVYEVKRYIKGKVITETFGNNFFELLIQNNKIIIGKYHKNWYNYSLSLFEHIENQYTRIYHLNSINIIIKTCYSYKCEACSGDYNICENLTKPKEFYDNPDNCYGIFNNKCYPRCPEGTCLDPDDIELLNCIPVDINTTVLNYICFKDLESIMKNIKFISDMNESINIRPDIIIRGYSTKSVSDKLEPQGNHSVVYLDKCENRLKQYYNLSENTELYILGIDSPNKNKSYSTSVYNYEVLLENGTELDHLNACKDIKITISSLITNTNLFNFDIASYFSELGYDIYDENSSFYTDNCAPASINGNDITLEDRKKDFYPSNISLCNESCSYININFTSKRFKCECNLDYNFSSYYSNKGDEKEEKDDISYLEFFLSLINYKISVCYVLFFDFKSYYYNAGFYIAFGTLLFCICQMIIFLKWGIFDIKKIILANLPNKMKLLQSYKEQEEKRKELIKLKIELYVNYNNINNPNKKLKILNNIEIDKNLDNLEKNNEGTNKEDNINNDNTNNENNFNYLVISNNNDNNDNNNNDNCDNNNNHENFEKIKKRYKRKKRIAKKKIESKRNNASINLLDDKEIFNKKYGTRIYKKDSHSLLKVETKRNMNDNKSIILYDKDKASERYINNSINEIDNNIYNIMDYTIDNQVNKKELNNITYTQALRIDKRNYIQIFLSVLAKEIDIINIFYYRNQYNHISIVLSTYIFELCLDLTLNCFLYTDDVVSEKYHNNGSIGFFTSLSLSFMSNIFSSIIAFIVKRLVDYSEILDFILKDSVRQNEYYSNIIKFRKYLILKLIVFYLIQMKFNLFMCYYLMIFCTVYHKTQGSIMLNYLIGIAESLGISLTLSLITSLIRFLSIKNKWKTIYYTSKYFFEKF